ncbi:MAG: T9SS type A sorting domain-containing protein [Saprospiraceae bacterium]
MKKIIPLIIFTFTTLGLFAQCDELFISEYVEGYGNNRALEIYNPTNAAVDLSAYSIGRFSNGGVSYVGIALPAENLAPYETYVAVLDKRDSLGFGLETPVWNGFQLWDYCTDIDTGDTLLYADGDTIFCVQYNADGLHLYGTEYNDWLDLEGKANGYFCPVYNVNNAMYFNGNDAVALVKGLTINGDGSNVIDVIGVVGEDPGDAWVSADGGWLTRDKTLAKKSGIQMGSGPVIAALQDTFQYENYNIWGKNSFIGIGTHECTCDPDFMTSTEELNQIAFNLFPNPTSNELWVEAQVNIERVEIYNLLGERMLVQNYGTDASNKTNISVNNLETGMYVISLFFDGEHQSTQKFIKR